MSWENLFQKIGLSKYEARLYVSLAIKGPAEARNLGASSGVPRTKVYDILRKLVEQGLVIETFGEPLQFTVTSPADSFKTLINRLKDDLSERVMSLVELEDAVSVLEEIHRRRQSIKPLSSQFGDVWFIHGRNEILHRIREMLSATKKSVYVLTTENGLILFYKSFDKLLSKLIKKNVRVKIKASIGVVNRSLVNELRHDYDIANTDVSTPLLFVCTDERRLLQVRLRPDSFNVGSGEDLGFFSESQTLYVFFASLYGFLYE